MKRKLKRMALVAGILAASVAGMVALSTRSTTWWIACATTLTADAYYFMAGMWNTCQTRKSAQLTM